MSSPEIGLLSIPENDQILRLVIHPWHVDYGLISV